MAHHLSIPDPRPTPFTLAVLNPKGRDPFLDFDALPEEPIAGLHAPINFHAFAAATGGAFFDSASHLLEQKDRFSGALVLIRKRIWISLDAVRELKAAGIPVIVAWKECSESQIAKQLRSLRARRAYTKLISLSDGILSPTSAPPPCPSGIAPDRFAAKCRLVPTPYPLEHSGWNFSRPLETRKGILVGTREFRSEMRNHARAIEELAELAKRFPIDRITAINSEGKRGSSRLHSLAKQFPDGVLQIIETALPYPNYLRLLATHQLVFQRDLGGVPGQVAGDCLLARILCVGGNSRIEQLAFPEFCAGENSMDQLGSVLTRASAYAKAIETSQARAVETLSFTTVANTLARWDVFQKPR